MKAISLTRPWPYAVLHLGKRIENRSRRDGRMPHICHHRGPLLLHAAKSWDGCVGLHLHEAGFISDSAMRTLEVPALHPAGAIVGRCAAVGHLSWNGWFYPHPAEGRTNVGCRRVEDLEADGLDMRWWSGGYALVLADVEPTPVVPCRGALGLWTVPEDVMRRLGDGQ